MAHIKNTLLEWCNQNVDSLAENIGTQVDRTEISNQEALCNYAAEIGMLSGQAATLLEEFRPLVHEPIAADLDMSLQMLTTLAHLSGQLLAGYLSRWPNETLISQYEPIINKLNHRIEPSGRDS